MKKVVLALLSFTFVVSLILVPAASASAVTWSDPVITPLTGDKEFTVKVIDPVALSSGTTKTTSGLTVPAGFPLGAMQFGGNAVVLKGMESGTARTCFSFPNYRFGWKGGIYQWNGTKWSIIPSTTTEGVEGAPATICTNISADGTYALLMGYTLRSTPITINTLPVCSDDFIFDLYLFYLDESDTDTTYVVPKIVMHPGVFPIGTTFSYSIFNISPAGSISGALSQSGSIQNIGDSGMTGIGYFVEDPFSYTLYDFPPSMNLIIKKSTIPSFTLRITTPTCYKDFSSSDDVLAIIGMD